MALPSASRIDFADIVCDVEAGCQEAAEEKVVSRCNGRADELQKARCTGGACEKESDGRKEGRSWRRAVRKLAEVGLLTACA